ncbi:(5-formylfuran-3-yl)methyl phosphate synthase [Hansschlegelia beijingensis]|uniref:(5-formylfuran-3-yl)methyl phosphate synthase n=1 Tax=Hansschlegelia beijingensis TaxID=1133344 RepID=UPI00387F2143
MTGFLASVSTLEEIELVRAGGADIVDLKNPAQGALGAWETSALTAAVARWRAWPGPKPALSATIGDQPMTPDVVRAAAERVAATGVPLVKLGLFAGDVAGCLAALQPLANRAQLIAVFLADRAPDFGLLPQVAAAGFRGAMLDTADKSAGGLRAHLTEPDLRRFVGAARGLGLLTGLAGSLKSEDVAPLAGIGPDYLGFRGALCEGGRTGRLHPAAMASIRQALAESRQAA